MIKKHASDKNKCILMLIQQITAIVMVVILVTLLTQVSVRSDRDHSLVYYNLNEIASDNEESFQESSSFSQMFSEDISALIYYLAICQQFEENGKFDKNRSIDLLSYVQRKWVSPESVTSDGLLNYRIGDLINWEDISGIDVKAAGEAMIDEDGGEYYPEQHVIERYLPTDGVSIYQKDLVSILESAGLWETDETVSADAENVSETAQEYDETDWPAKDQASEETVSGETLQDDGTMNDALSFAYDGTVEIIETEDSAEYEKQQSKAQSIITNYIMEAARDLSVNYKTYTAQNDYFKNNKSIKYFYSPNVKKNIYYTNCKGGGETTAEHIRAFKKAMKTGSGSYIRYNLSNDEFTTVRYDEEDVNHTELSRYFYDYSYAFRDKGVFYIAYINSDEEAEILDGEKLTRADAYGKLENVYGNVKPNFMFYVMVLAVSLFLFVISFFIWCGMVGYRREKVLMTEDGMTGQDSMEYRLIRAEELYGFDRLYTGIFLILAVAVEAGIFLLMALLILDGYMDGGLSFLTDHRLIRICAVLTFLWILGAQFFFASFLRRVKAHTFWKNSVICRLFRLAKKAVGHIMLAVADKNALVNLWIPYLLFLVMNLAIIAIGHDFSYYFWEFVAFAFVLDILVGIVGHRLYRERREVLDGINRIADGEITYQVDLSRMHGQNVLFARAVNHIGDGIHEAVQISMKDERLKADLITNVSHDIKTPLTSIINYVDLLKRVDIKDEKAQEYLRILDEKSQRLKQLTLDLVEASKISSGNIVLHFEPLRVKDLMMQVIGEFSDKFEEKDLTVIAGFPEEPVVIEADSRRMWRVMENLFNNIYKYAMQGTRVYLDIELKDRVYIIVKNISMQKLNVSADELTERFIRGDISRSTEGSGLGLSIAKSLVEAQKGEFEIVLDGDLFKVIMRFDEMAKETAPRTEIQEIEVLNDVEVIDHAEAMGE